MPVKYHKCDDGRIIFGKGWSDFVDSEELKVHKDVLFGFKTTTREDLQIEVVMNMLTEEPQKQHDNARVSFTIGMVQKLC